MNGLYTPGFFASLISDPYQRLVAYPLMNKVAGFNYSNNNLEILPYFDFVYYYIVSMTMNTQQAVAAAGGGYLGVRVGTTDFAAGPLQGETIHIGNAFTTKLAVTSAATAGSVGYSLLYFKLTTTF